MDVRQYFHKMRQIESQIASNHVVVVSRETGDGGKPGVLTEVSRGIAAKLIVEGRADLATEAESKAYYAAEAEKREAAQRADLANRVQVTLVAEPEAVRGPVNKGQK